MRARVTVVGSVCLSGQEKLLRCSRQLVMHGAYRLYRQMLGLICVDFAKMYGSKVMMINTFHGDPI